MICTDIIQSTRRVAEHAQDVHVDADACRRAGEEIRIQMQKRDYTTHTWSMHELNPIVVPGDLIQETKTHHPGRLVLSPQQAVDWIFTVDLLNFSFWSETPDESHRFSVTYNGKVYTGYWSLIAALNRALADGTPITSPYFWRSPAFTAGTEVLEKVFASDTHECVPLLRERHHVLLEAGRRMHGLQMDSFVAMVDRADHSAQTLLSLVTSEFPSFYDTSMYDGCRVSIFKRAQILVADLWACFNGTGYGQFADIDSLTMFADYRVAQRLYTLGCIKYSPRLESHIRAGKLIDHNHPWEVELRACSIRAVELMRPVCRANAVLIDFFLWDTAKEQERHAPVPCHRTRSIYY